MAITKLALATLSIEQKIQLVADIRTAMTDNPRFPTPNPSLVELSEIAEDLKQNTSRAAEARQISMIATLTQDRTEDGLDVLLTQLAAYVDHLAKGDEATILSAGLAVRGGSVLIGPLPVPGPVAVNSGDASGELDVSWPRMVGAKSFVIQYSVDPDAPGDEWKFATSSTKSSCTLTGLTPGARYWVRVAASGAAGQSAWSAPAPGRAS